MKEEVLQYAFLFLCAAFGVFCIVVAEDIQKFFKGQYSRGLELLGMYNAPQWLKWYPGAWLFRFIGVAWLSLTALAFIHTVSEK